MKTLLKISVVTLFLVGCGGGSTEPPGPPSIQVTPPSLSLVVGETAQLSAVIKDADGNVVSGQILWQSNKGLVAEVSPDGMVTALSACLAEVFAQVGAIVSNTVTVRVNDPPAGSAGSPAKSAGSAAC